MDPSGQAATEHELARKALDHLRSLLGSADASTGFFTDGGVLATSTGMRIVHLRQEYQGIPVHDASIAVHFDADQEIDRVVGDLLSVPADVVLTPRVTASEAVLAAALHVVEQLGTKRDLIPIKVSRRAPVQLGRFAHASRPTMLHKAPFKDPVTARLTLYGPRNRLAWEIHFRLPKTLGEWSAIVSADTPNDPTILHAWSSLAHATHGLIFEFNPGEAVRARLAFPCPRARYPAFLDRALPPGHESWVSDGQTRGNNVVCLKGSTKSSYPGARSGDDLLFEPTDEAGMDQRMLNAFYLTNFLHDFFLLLGFDEAARNFQSRNFSGQGGDDDRLVVRIFDRVIAGMATIRSFQDGTSPELNLGLRGKRHTALDAEVVIHEYVHGVTNRTVGGGANEDPLRRTEQSRAMGEGYSDYFAVSIMNFYRRQATRDERGVYGAWIADNKNTGLRRHAYGPTFPDTYDTLRASPNLEAHEAGQVWGEALLRVNEALGRDDRDAGDQLGWQLVMDSLKLLPVGPEAPTFLDGRTALFRAFDAAVLDGAIPGDPATLRTAVEKVFADLGMGPAAASPTARYRDIVAAFGT